MLYNSGMNRTTKNKLFKAIGLMSGTSADGVDVALIETDGEAHVRFIASSYLPYTDDFQAKIIAFQKGDYPFADFLRLEKELTLKHAEAVNAFMQENSLKPDDIDIIGFHGQTVRHLPNEGITCQLGNPSLLAYETKIPVVSDFRRMDMADGGQGAPLVPLFHASLFAKFEKPCAVVNIGGVANATILLNSDVTAGEGAAASSGAPVPVSGEILSSDTGPGMGLVDELVVKHTNGAEKYDKDGKYAQAGRVDTELLRTALDMPFFNKMPPKSADRHEFAKVLENIEKSLKFEDAVATLCAVTAQGIGQTLKQSLKGRACTLKAVYLTGGGAYHPSIKNELKQALGDDVQVFLAEDFNLRCDSMEAECFAWLAVRRLNNKPFTAVSTTACKKGLSGGILTAHPDKLRADS